MASAWPMARRRPIWKYGHDGPGVCLGDGQAYLKDVDMTNPASAWVMATVAYLRDMGMMSLASACAWPDGGRRSTRHKVDAATL